MPGRATLPATSTTIDGGDELAVLSGADPTLDDGTTTAGAEDPIATGAEEERDEVSHQTVPATVTTTAPPSATTLRRPGAHRNVRWPVPSGGGTPSRSRTRSATRSRSPRTPPTLGS